MAQWIWCWPPEPEGQGSDPQIHIKVREYGNSPVIQHGEGENRIRRASWPGSLLESVSVRFHKSVPP